MAAAAAAAGLVNAAALFSARHLKSDVFATLNAKVT